MVLRDPLHPQDPDAAPGQSPDPSSKALWPGPERRKKPRPNPVLNPQHNRRVTDHLGEPGEDSSRYPSFQWPLKTRKQRIALLDEITADLRAGRLDAIGAYHERLRWAYRCLKEGI